MTSGKLRALATFAVLAVSTPALADDWASSLYSEGGVELRADERIFTLFAALNALGLDDAPVTRKDPVPKREFDPVRQKVRDAVRLDPALRAKFEAFFDKHPSPIRTYSAFTLALGEAPKFALEKALPPELAPLKGFEALLAEFHAQAKIGPLFAEVVPAQREALKRYAPVVDKPLGKARELLKAPETDDSPRVVLVVNLLDGRGAGVGVQSGEEIYLVVGPSGATPDVQSIVKAFARVIVQGPAERKFTALKGGPELLAEVKESGRPVGAENVADYVAETFARAVAVKATAAEGQAAKALESEHKSGFVLIKDFNRGLALFGKAGKPLDTFLGDFLRELDAGKAAAALKGDG